MPYQQPLRVEDDRVRDDHGGVADQHRAERLPREEHVEALALAGRVVRVQVEPTEEGPEDEKRP